MFFGRKRGFDAWNRLAQVKGGSTIIGTYSYNGLNQRVRKIIGSETRLFYFNHGWQCLEEYVGSAYQSRYYWGSRYIDDLVLRERPSESLYVIQGIPSIPERSQCVNGGLSLVFCRFFHFFAHPQRLRVCTEFVEKCHCSSSQAFAFLSSILSTRSRSFVIFSRLHDRLVYGFLPLAPPSIPS